MTRDERLQYMRNYNRVYQKERYRREKQALIERLGGACAICGATENLEFDHKKRGDKKFCITGELHSRELDSELEKCQLLCHDCHWEKTLKELGWNDWSKYPANERQKFKRRAWYQKHREEINKRRRDRRKTQNALQKHPTRSVT